MFSVSPPGGRSLPPLREVIPEFHSAPPLDRPPITPPSPQISPQIHPPATLYDPRSSSPNRYSHHGAESYYHQEHLPSSDLRPGDPTGPSSRLPYSPNTTHNGLSMDHYDQDRNMGTKRRRGNLPKPVTDLLRAWLRDHVQHPYPTEEEKQMLMQQTGLTIHQISNWFINARRRRLPTMNGGSDVSKRQYHTSPSTS